MLATLLDLFASTCWILLQTACGFILADFLSGLFHWLEDRYGSPRRPGVGPIIAKTIRHHARPMRITRQPLLLRSAPVFLLVSAAFTGLYLAGWMNPMALTALALLAFSNEIHALAHRSPAKNGPVISRLQKWGVMQSFARHAAHHRGLKNTHYCTITDRLNPVLEETRFWRRLEALIRVIARQRPRRDPTVRRRQRRLNRKSLEKSLATG